MPGGVKCHINIADAVGLAIGGGLAGAGEFLAVAGRHRLDGFGRGEDGAVAGAGVVRVAMRDDGAIDPTADRIDVEVAGRAVEAPRGWAEQVFGADHVGNMSVGARLAKSFAA